MLIFTNRMSKDEALGSTNINLWTKGRGVSQETRVTPLTQLYAGVKGLPQICSVIMVN